VLPAYWLALAGSVALLHGTGHWRLVEDGRLVAFALFAQNLSPDLAGRLDPPMWTLTVEVSFYVALPLIGALALRLGGGRARQLAATATVAGLGIAWIAVLQPDGAPPEVLRTLPALLPVFACGMAARILAEGRSIGPRAAWTLLAAGCALVVVHAERPLTGTAGNLARDLPAAVGFAAICVACATPSAPRVLTSWPVRTLGTLSFGIYLWHYPIMLGLQTRGLWPADDLAAALAVTGALSILAAWVSWRLVERPVLERIRSRRGGSRLPADPPQQHPARGRARDELGDAAALGRRRLAHPRDRPRHRRTARAGPRDRPGVGSAGGASGRPRDGSHGQGAGARPRLRDRGGGLWAGGAG
jgi:peptidoglycan/LPS O-acetylase OafA/YrhL